MRWGTQTKQIAAAIDMTANIIMVADWSILGQELLHLGSQKGLK